MKPAGSCSLLLDRNGHLKRLALKLRGADYGHEPDPLGCTRSPGEGGKVAARNEERGWGLPLTCQRRHTDLALGAGARPNGEKNLRATGDGNWRVDLKGNRHRWHHGW